MGKHYRNLWLLLLNVFLINLCPEEAATYDYDEDPLDDLYFEGDIRIDPNDPTGRGFIGDDKYRWDLPICVKIDPVLQYWSIEIWNALVEIMDKTCVRFYRLLDDEYCSSFIYYTNATEGKCSSWVGRRGGKQDINLIEGCFAKYNYQHEMLHALGFYHEHNRKDRDEYIIVNWDNIKPGKEGNFLKALDSRDFGVPYDYGSIMHYNPFTFGKTADSVTMQPVGDPKSPEFITAWRHMFLQELTQFDFEQINWAFNCTDYLPPHRNMAYY